MLVVLSRHRLRLYRPLSLLGIAREIYSLALVMLILGLPITMINALSVSLWQAKVPPELQGRFFAVRMQFALMFQPIAYFFTGAR